MPEKRIASSYLNHFKVTITHKARREARGDLVSHFKHRASLASLLSDDLFRRRTDSKLPVDEEKRQLSVAWA